MHRLGIQVLVVLLLLFSGVGVVVAEATDGAEIELIIDYLNRHQVTVILPSGISPEPLRDLVSSIVSSPLLLQGDWTAEDGMRVWLYDAPHLVAGAGAQKSELWDCSQLAATAAAMGLETGVNLFLVVNQPAGALSYDAYVSDLGVDLSPVAADSMEIWWGFGLRPGGAAPKLSVLIWLKPLINLVTLAPLWVPLLVALALLALGRRLETRVFQRLQSGLSWLVVVSSVLLAFLMQWQSVLSFLFGSSAGLPGLASLLLTAFVPFAYSALLVRLPYHRRQAHERQERWSFRRYLADSWRLLFGFAALLAMGLLWFGLVRFCYPISIWLSLSAGLLALAFILLLLVEVDPILRFGKRPGADFGAEAMIRSLSARLRINPPQLHFVSFDKVPQANAFAAGIVFPRVYVTQLLWDSLNQSEQQFILAHELAHTKRRDTLRLFALYLLPASFLAISLILLLFEEGNWALGVAGGLLLAAVAFVFGITTPARRKMESGADALALQATGDPLAAASALRRMHPGRVDAKHHRQSSHPKLDLRLEQLRKFKGGE